MEKRLRYILKKNKKDLAPLAFTVGAFVLLAKVVLPQISEISDLRSNIETQTARNQGLLQSESTLAAINDAELNADYEIVLNSLPRNKSIGAIFEALTSAANKSNVSIGSLNLQVGSVYDQDINSVEKNVIQGVQFINLLVRATGSSSSDLTYFAEVLYKTLPVVEINSIGVSEKEGRYDVNFYFKPINEKGFQAQTLVAPLSPQQQELLNTLKEWSN